MDSTLPPLDQMDQLMSEVYTGEGVGETVWEDIKSPIYDSVVRLIGPPVSRLTLAGSSCLVVRLCIDWGGGEEKEDTIIFRPRRGFWEVLGQPVTDGLPVLKDGKPDAHVLRHLMYGDVVSWTHKGKMCQARLARGYGKFLI